MRLISVLGCAATIAVVAGPAWSAPEENRDPLQIFVSERIAHDDNLYRLPDNGPGLFDPSGRAVHSNDYLNQASLGVDGRWDIARQVFKLQLQADDNRYSHNDQLNFVGGTGKADWDWQLGNDLSGILGADYSRSLVNYAAERILTKDIVKLTDSYGEARYRLGSRWSVSGNVRYSETTHTSDILRVDDFHSKNGGFGLQYATPGETVIGLDYRYTDATFPRSGLLNGLLSDSNYTQNLTSVRLKYGLTGKLTLDAMAGYLDRKYDVNIGEDFSGDVWKASLLWSATVKTQVTFSAYRQLTAYVDVESDYYVGTGFRVSPSWAPTTKLTFALDLTYEDQDYLRSVIDPFLTADRRDHVKSGQIVATYTPQTAWRFDLTYRREDRHSNRDEFQYNDNLAAAGVRFTF
jgi:exopolysaccharide biosynthesis operon protein EpsL